LPRSRPPAPARSRLHSPAKNPHRKSVSETWLRAQHPQQGLRLGRRRDVMPSHHERRRTASSSPCSGCPKGAPVRPRRTASRRLADAPASPSPLLPAGGGQQASVQHDGCLVWISALEEALARFGSPEILDTDQGSQFTRAVFTGTCRGRYAHIDGRLRWADGERVHRAAVAPP